MTTNAPSNADLGGTPALKEQDTAAAILSDDRLDAQPGGGGLMGAGAADAHAGSAEGQAGAATPNSPIDAELPHASGNWQAEAEAQTRALGDEPSERTTP